MKKSELKPVESSLLFQGRADDPRLGQWVQTEFVEKSLKQTATIYGCPDDIGVQRNRGRPGASGGPSGIRKHFYKIAMPIDPHWEKHLLLLDIGNIEVTGSIADNHAAAYHAAFEIARHGQCVIPLGGGHDYVAPNFSGFAAGYREKHGKNKRLGLINIDPHLDVRPLENEMPHSGTGFRQIVDNQVINGSDFTEFGARSGRNAREHFTYCEKKKIRVLLYDIVRRKDVTKVFQQELTRLTKSCDAVGISVDMDACCDGEGVSAPAVLGFNAWEMCQFAFIAGKNPKVKYFEIAEVAPALETTDRTARVAAEVIFYFLQGQNERLAKPKKKK